MDCESVFGNRCAWLLVPWGVCACTRTRTQLWAPHRRSVKAEISSKCSIRARRARFDSNGTSRENRNSVSWRSIASAVAHRFVSYGRAVGRYTLASPPSPSCVRAQTNRSAELRRPRLGVSVQRSLSQTRRGTTFYRDRISQMDHSSFAADHSDFALNDVVDRRKVKPAGRSCARMRIEAGSRSGIVVRRVFTTCLATA